MENENKNNSFERALPEGYKQVLHLSAKDVKVGILMNLGALAITALAYVVLILPITALLLPRITLPDGVGFTFVAGIMIGAIAFLPLVVVHELIHGWAYKRRTGEKLTFGMSWSCAYCGVPGIYTYRSTALYSLLAPMVIISALTLLGSAVCLTVSLCLPADSAAQETLLLLIGTFISLFACHLGGCVGDGYMALLFAFRLRDPRTLMRDTGPEQYAYVPEDGENADGR